MWNCENYILNGTCNFENILEQLDTEDFETIRIGGSGSVIWYIYLRTDADRTVIYPAIGFEEDGREGINFGIRVFFNILNSVEGASQKEENRLVLSEEMVTTGPMIPILDLVNTEKGWLNEIGQLSIEYGLHVDSVLNQDGIWEFNFFDQLDIQENLIMFDSYRHHEWYCQNWLLCFHSPYFVNREKDDRFNMEMKDTFQLSHGVRLKLNNFDSLGHNSYARYYGLWNVARYTEQQIIEATYFSPFNPHPKTLGNRIQCSIVWELNRVLVNLLKSSGSTEELIKVLKKGNLKEMSSETMKIIIASCVYGKFLNYY